MMLVYSLVGSHCFSKSFWHKITIKVQFFMVIVGTSYLWKNTSRGLLLENTSFGHNNKTTCPIFCCSLSFHQIIFIAWGRWLGTWVLAVGTSVHGSVATNTCIIGLGVWESEGRFPSFRLRAVLWYLIRSKVCGFMPAFIACLHTSRDWPLVIDSHFLTFYTNRHL